MKKPIKLQSELFVDNIEELDEIIHYLVNDLFYMVATGHSVNIDDRGAYKIEVYMEVMNYESLL